MMHVWGRIADTAITALKEQIARLQEERDELMVELAEDRDSPPEILWRPVSEQLPEYGERVLLTDGQTVFLGCNFCGRWQTSKDIQPEYWMPIPKLPEAWQRVIESEDKGIGFWD
jgi:hypothetical protein